MHYGGPRYMAVKRARRRVDIKAILRDPQQRALLIRRATTFICSVERIDGPHTRLQAFLQALGRTL